MLTMLLGSILVFVTSVARDVVQYFQDRKDKAHELTILNRQIERDQVLHDQRLEEITLEADGAAILSRIVFGRKLSNFGVRLEVAF